MRARLIIVLAAAALIVVGLPAATAQAWPGASPAHAGHHLGCAPRVLVCHVKIAVDTADPNGYWKGSMTGAIRGTVGFWEQQGGMLNVVVGDKEFFFEDFEVTTESGDVIRGVDAGVWSLTNWKFNANGWVNQASGTSAYLVGYKFAEKGTTTPYPPPPELGSLILGKATTWFTPPRLW
jgi:hypothetical protein